MADQFDNFPAVEIPYSQEAEEATIGAVIVNPAYYDSVAAFLQAEDFFLLRHKYIWQALGKMVKEKTPVDNLTLAHTLKDMDKLADIGGPAYLTQLVNSTPTSVHAEIYGRIVESTATRRRLMSAVDEIKARAQNTTITLDDVIKFTDDAIADIRPEPPGIEIYSMREIMSLTWDRLIDQTAIKAAGGNGLAGLSSGLYSLDQITNGWQPEQFILIGGRPGMGKSAVMAFFATVIAKLPLKANGKPYRVYMWSGEMSLQQLGRRFLSAETSIDGSKILTANLNQKENKIISDGFGTVGNLEIYVDLTVRMTPLKLRRNIKRAQRMFGGFDMAVVDYCQLMRADGKVFGQEEELTQISRGLKEICREFKMPVMSGAQLNRAVENRDDKHPVLSDLRGSGSLEQDADVIIFPFFPSYYVDSNIKAGFMEFNVAKNRDGMTGTVKDVYCNFGLMQFEEGFGIPI